MGEDTLGMTYELRRQSRGVKPPQEPRIWRKRLLRGGIALVCVGSLVAAYFIWRAVAYVRTSKAHVWAKLIDVSPEVDARLEELLVKLGDTVAEGAVLARLDDSQLRAALEAAEATTAIRQSQHAQAQARLRLTMTQVATAVELAQAQVEVAAARVTSAEAALSLRKAQVSGEIRRAEAEAKEAQAWLDRVKKGPRPEEIQVAEARLATARARAELYTTEVEESEKLVAKGIESRHILDVKKTQLIAQQNAVRQAELQLAMLREGATVEEVQAHTQMVAGREADLALAKAGSKSLDGLQADLQIRKAELDEAKAELKRAQGSEDEIEVARGRVKEAEKALEAAAARVAIGRAQLEATTIRSPVTGTVHRTFDDVGEFCRRGVTTIKIADDSRGRWIDGLIREEDRRHVQVGQKAKVKVGLHTRGYVKATVVAVGDATLSATSSNPDSADQYEQFGVPGQFWVKLELLEEFEDKPPHPGTSARAIIRVW